jgi:hypothetical protein
MAGLALLVGMAPLTLHILRAQARTEAVQVPPGAPGVEAELLPLPMDVAEPNAVSAGALTAPLTFVGITPCRIVDTRAGQGFSGAFGPPSLVANASRTFQITGTTTGTPTQCGIPDAAVAISVNFTVTGFASAGDIRVYPAGGTLPLASILNYQLETIANATTVPLGPSGSGHNGIAVQADVAATDFIADVNGYYLPSGRLASGQTMTGVWSIAGFPATTAGEYLWTAVSFPLRLASAPAAPVTNFIAAPGTASTTSCPGTVGNPLAAPGQLCVYARTCGNANISCLFATGGTGCNAADTTGFGIYMLSAGAAQSYCYGTWAVTAP